MPSQQGFGIGLRQLGSELDRIQFNKIFVQPFAIGLFGSYFMFDLVVADDAACYSIDDQHPARPQTVFFDNGRRIQIDDADLGGQNDRIILSNVIAGRPQAVAVQSGADSASVGKGHGGRSVPGFDQRIMVFKKSFQIRIDMRIFAPWFGNHHHYSMRQAASRHDKKFQTVIEHSRIRAGFVDDRHDIFDLAAPEAVAAHRLAGAHPVDVAAQGIDLAVMHQITVRMGAFPAGKGVGAETGMD